jgi:hypothetical protein
MPRIVQNVDERIPNLAGSAKRARMESIREDFPSPSPELIERPSQAHGETLHPARQRAAVVRLDDQVHVIRLDRKLVQAEPEAIAPQLECAKDSGAREMPAQARQALAQAKRHMERMARVVVRALGMRDARSEARWLATRALSGATPLAEPELVLLAGVTTSTHRRLLLSPAWTAPTISSCEDS